MLDYIGVPEWTTDTDNETQVIVEAAGKLCYMSFSTSLNANLTRTGGRDNATYIQEGLIGTKHGSVLEHTAVNIAFLDVSRVFTHELIRHRPGAAYSQTSGRYVRTRELAFWMPSCISEDPVLRDLFIAAVEHQEDTLKAMCDHVGMDTMKDFSKKKELTSAFRRIVGNGVANNIMATYNHRALRHLITVRTHESAEEEIRVGFGQLFDVLVARYPAIYQDAKVELVRGIPSVSFLHEKV